MGRVKTRVIKIFKYFKTVNKEKLTVLDSIIYAA